MPCGDMTEKIRLTLDSDNRVDSYSLSKKTCGGAVGLESLLLSQVAGLSVDQIIGDDDLSLLRSGETEDEIEAYLRHKHFYAIKSALNVYVGAAPGGAGDPCTIAGIERSSEYTVIDAEIRIDLLADQVEPCDHCGPG